MKRIDLLKNMMDLTKDIKKTVQYDNAEYKRTSVDLKATSAITLSLTFIAIIMSYMNYTYAQYEMLTATVVLSLSLICTLIFGILTKNKMLVDIMLCTSLSGFLLYFTLTGGNDGFAILWTLLLPSSMLTLIGFGYGITFGAVFEVFFILLFWTPLRGMVSAHYTQTFMLRFPMLYTAFFILSFIAKYIITVQEITKNEALSANKAKSEFLSRVSHELRTPLNVILGMAKLGLNDKSLGESRDRFDRIIASSSHLANIINDVLEMSRMESGKTEIKREPLRLKELAADCMNLFTAQAAEKGIDFDSSLDETLPEMLVGDAFRIKQVLINLLSNALKFTEKGKVSLEVGLAQRDGDRCMVLFAVTDTGIGMSDAFLQKAFIPFEQEDSFFSRRYEGSGLGLPISYNLVGLMDGTLEVESELGHGSRFIFTIPFTIAEMEIEKESGTSGAAAPSLAGKRILIVDDIEINRMIACELLAGTGADLEEACDGEEACEKFLQSPPGYYHCIFMDIQMPKMDGYMATSAIRASQRPDNRVPIVAMTANALKEDVDSAIEAGMNDHIAKPIDFAECLQKAARWCEAS